MADKKNTYIVDVLEVYVIPHRVKANSSEEAREIVEKYDWSNEDVEVLGDEPEFVSRVPKEEWFFEKA